MQVFKPYTFAGKTLFAALISLSVISCKNGGNDVESSKETAVAAEFYISNLDSGLQLQFSNYKLRNKDSFQLFINNQKAVYRLLSEDILFVGKQVLNNGKNDIRFIYYNGQDPDTAYGLFVNPARIEYELVNTYRHNGKYFTQGLLFDESGRLIESTGLNGESKILFYGNYRDGSKPLDSIINEEQEFGEGIAVVNGELLQLLWKNMYIRIYDKKSHAFIRKADYGHEGWGICNDGSTIYTSDGSSSIYKIDVSGTQTRVFTSVTVQDEKGTVANLNELEFINGKIFANIWQSTVICIIDPESGAVTGKLDLSALVEKEIKTGREIDVLNGIAYDPEKGTILVTGKHWGSFYEIRLEPPVL
jgi:glutamine cyclotransferase